MENVKPLHRSQRSTCGPPYRPGLDYDWDIELPGPAGYFLQRPAGTDSDGKALIEPVSGHGLGSCGAGAMGRRDAGGISHGMSRRGEATVRSG